MSRRRKSLWRNPGDPGYSDEWYTPPELVQRLGPFDLDPCAARLGPVNHAKENWRRIDGLTRQWRGRVFLNPPYSSVAAWLDKMAKHGNGIALVNSWTERKWFQKAISTSDGILFLYGRVGFLRVLAGGGGG